MLDNHLYVKAHYAIDTLMLPQGKDHRVKPVYSRHLWFLKKVSSTTRYLQYRSFQVIFTGSKFYKSGVFWSILQKLVPQKIIAKLLIREICEI